MPRRNRLSAFASLAAFLAAQSWVLCAVVCLSGSAAPGHPGASASPMAMTMHDGSCHTHGVREPGPLVQQALSPMLTAAPTGNMPEGRLLAVEPVVLTHSRSLHIPAAEPPPPRSA